MYKSSKMEMINNRQPSEYISGEYREEKDLEQIHLLLGFEGIDYHQ